MVVGVVVPLTPGVDERGRIPAIVVAVRGGCRRVHALQHIAGVWRLPEVDLPGSAPASAARSKKPSTSSDLVPHDVVEHRPAFLCRAPEHLRGRHLIGVHGICWIHQPGGRWIAVDVRQGIPHKERVDRRVRRRPARRCAASNERRVCGAGSPTRPLGSVALLTETLVESRRMINAAVATPVHATAPAVATIRRR